MNRRIIENNNENTHELKIRQNDEDVSLTFIIDTGSQINCLSLEIFKKIKNVKIYPIDIRLSSADGSPLNVYRKIKMISENNIVEFYITDTSDIIGYLDAIRLKLIQFNVKVIKVNDTEFKTLFSRFFDVISAKPGLTNIIEHFINLKTNCEFKQARPFPV
ncbi:hypothetical protein A3Q56_08673, partial [Intoshia linei]